MRRPGNGIGLYLPAEHESGRCRVGASDSKESVEFEQAQLIYIIGWEMIKTLGISNYCIFYTEEAGLRGIWGRGVRVSFRVRSRGIG